MAAKLAALVRRVGGVYHTKPLIRKVERLIPQDDWCACMDRRGSSKVSDQPARVLILSVPSCGLDQIFAELTPPPPQACQQQRQ